jgi:HD-like signal output (HDOD) protein
MLAGLLHEIGKFYILTRVEAFPELFTDEKTLEEVTQQWYTGIGCTIVEFWGFGEAVAQAVDEHNDLTRVHSGAPDLTDAVQVAYVVSQFKDPDCIHKLNPAEIPACQLMNIDAEYILSLIQESAEMVNSISHALST